MKFIESIKKNFFQVCIAALLGIFLILIIFPLFKYKAGDFDVLLNGYNVIFGKELPNSNPFVVRSNAILIISLFLVVCSTALNFTKLFENKIVIKKFINVFSLAILFISFYGFRDYFVAFNVFNQQNNFVTTTLEKISLIILLLAVFVSIVDFAKNFKLDKDTNIIKCCLALIVLLGLFINLYGFSNSAANIKLNGLNLMVGIKYEEKILGLSEIPGNLGTIFAFVGVLLILVVSIVNMFRKLNILDKFSKIFLTFSMYHFVNLSSALTFNISKTFNSSLSLYSQIINFALIIVFVLNVVEDLKGKDKIESLRIVSQYLILLFVFSIGLPNVYLYTKYNSSNGNPIIVNDVYSRPSTVIIEQRVNGHYANPIFYIISYVLAIASFVFSEVKTKFEKGKYLIISMLLIGSVLIYSLFNSTMYYWIKQSTYNHYDFAQLGVFAIIYITLAATINLYISATKPSNLLKHD